MKNWKRMFSALLALVMIVSCLPVVSAAENDSKMIGNVKVTELAPEDYENLLKLKSDDFRTESAYQFEDDEQVCAIVILEGEPTASQAGGAANFAFGNSARRLARQHNALKNDMDAEAIDYVVNYDYTTLLNGMAITVDYGDLEAIENLDGVVSVHLVNYYSLPDHTVYPDETIDMAFSNAMTGLNAVQNLGQMGSSMVIAVLDTGITPNHEAFQVYEGMLETPALTEEAVNAIVADGKVYPGVYLSAKIPFAYDYADHNTDATDDANGHGTHVAGIAAGYAEEGDAITFAGSAPDAQILAMKVFSSASAESTTNSAIYFKALEDAYLLGADVINMSLGSPGGFTYDPELDKMTYNIYQYLEENGVICCISAGNENSMAEYASNWAGPGVVTSDYADYGVVGSPSTYNGNLSVASVENSNFPYSDTLSFNGQNYIYADSSTSGTLFRDTLGGKEYEVVYAGLGSVEEFTKLEGAAEGKIALIMRGELSFQDKVLNAAAAGAVGTIIYNNTSGMISMQITNFAIPAVSVYQSTGETILEALKTSADPVLVTVNTESNVVENESGWQMSDFSSWGCTPDLQLKPQITGVGGMVNSVAYLTTNGYTLMSGTSMAAPNLTGGMATLLSYLKAQYPNMPKTERAAMAEALMMSSARELRDTDEYLYSPRKQGSGLMDLPAAMDLANKVYITDPICNLGDNEDGVFTISFTVQDLSGHGGAYAITPAVLIDYFDGGDLNGDDEVDLYNTLSSIELTPDEDYVYQTNYENNVVTLSAHGSAQVVVTVTLTDGAKNLLNAVYPNGNFVEGYINLTELTVAARGIEDSAEVNPDSLHATFMGFYGDWTKAPVLETADFRDIVDLETYLAATGYADMGYTYLDFLTMLPNQFNTDVNLAYAANWARQKLYGYPGDNAFTYVMPYDEARIAVSGPESRDALVDSLYMLPMNIRNARHLLMIVSDHETGEVYAVDDTQYLPKVRYNEKDSYWAGYSSFLFEPYDAEGNPLPNDTVVDIDYYANTAYGEDEIGAIIEEYGYEGMKDYGSDYLEWNFDCTVDTELPEILDLDYSAADGTLTVTLSDNQYVAYVEAMDPYTGKTIDYAGVTPEEKGETVEATLDVGDSKAVILMTADYATNYGMSVLWLTDCTVDVYANPEEGGEVSGAGVYEFTSEVTVTAEPNFGYRFEGWYVDDELVSTDEEYTFKVFDDCTLEARFAKLYRLVIFNGNDQIVELYAAGDEVTLDPGARRGFDFAGWNVASKNVVIEDNTFVMPASDVMIYAEWKPVEPSGDIEVPGPINPLPPTDNVPEGDVTDPTGGGSGDNDGDGTDEPAALPFTDVTKADWYYGDVAYAYENGLIQGTSDTTFDALLSTTRGMIASILWRLEGKPVVNFALNFPDVAEGMYYTEAVRWSVANDIFEGYDNGNFGPNDSITREQLAAILYRYAIYKGYDVSVGEDTNILSYPDVASVGEWAIPAMQWACGAGLISGDENGNLNPKGEASRAVLAAILHRFCTTYLG